MSTLIIKPQPEPKVSKKKKPTYGFRFNPHTPTLKRAEEEASKLRTEADRILNEARGNQLIECYECGKKSAVKTFTYENSYYYVPPRGCIDGDYHKWTGVKLICPKCGTERIIHMDYKGPYEEQILAYKYLLPVLRDAATLINEDKEPKW